jgi:fatty acid desaturase
MNAAVYHLASFMIVRNPVTWRWSHARHHTDTIIVGRDPEIAAMRPPAAARMLFNVVGIPDMIAGLSRMLLNASGRLDPEEATFVPESEASKVIRVARIWTAIYAATIALALATGSILPLMVIGLPRLYGAWHFILTGYLQHAGLADNVTDHRLNSRTVYMNPVSRFIYWNMNYHVEHHMFPMVTYHRLPDLHARIRHDLPAPSPSMWAAYREVLPVLRRQLRYEDVFLRRDLPPTARPYREDFHVGALGVPAE